MTIESLTDNLTRLRAKRAVAKNPIDIARYEHHIAEVERELAKLNVPAPVPASVPASAAASVPAPVPASVSASAAASMPAPVPASVPAPPKS